MKSEFASSLKSLRSKPISSSIVEMVTHYLLSGELKPGDKLPTEVELTQLLGVGRNSVREAIKMLSSLGVVEIRRGTGTFIAKSVSSSVVNSFMLSLVFEQRTSRELIEIRLLLDGGCTELAMEKVGKEDIDLLEEANLQLKEEAEKKNRNLKKIRDLDLKFHETLYELSGNRLLAKIGKAIYTMFTASIEKTIEVDPFTGYRNHQLIIEALRCRNAEMIRDVMRESLSFWIKLISSQES